MATVMENCPSLSCQRHCAFLSLWIQSETVLSETVKGLNRKGICLKLKQHLIINIFHIHQLMGHKTLLIDPLRNLWKKLKYVFLANEMSNKWITHIPLYSYAFYITICFLIICTKRDIIYILKTNKHLWLLEGKIQQALLVEWTWVLKTKVDRWGLEWKGQHFGTSGWPWERTCLVEIYIKKKKKSNYFHRVAFEEPLRHPSGKSSKHSDLWCGPQNRSQGGQQYCGEGDWNQMLERNVWGENVERQRRRTWKVWRTSSSLS